MHVCIDISFTPYVSLYVHDVFNVFLPPPRPLLPPSRFNFEVVRMHICIALINCYAYLLNLDLPPAASRLR